MNKQISRKITHIIKKYYRPKLDCDGQSRMFSWLLQQEGIKHTVNVGAVAWKGNIFQPHYWIVFPDSDYILDCKVRKWSNWLNADPQELPNGLFIWKMNPNAPLQYVHITEDSMVMTQELFEILDGISKDDDHD